MSLRRRDWGGAFAYERAAVLAREGKTPSQIARQLRMTRAQAQGLITLARKHQLLPASLRPYQRHPNLPPSAGLSSELCACGLHRPCYDCERPLEEYATRRPGAEYAG